LKQIVSTFYVPKRWVGTTGYVDLSGSGNRYSRRIDVERRVFALISNTIRQPAKTGRLDAKIPMERRDARENPRAEK